jgi:L-lactate permease
METVHYILSLLAAIALAILGYVARHVVTQTIPSIVGAVVAFARAMTLFVDTWQADLRAERHHRRETRRHMAAQSRDHEKQLELLREIRERQTGHSAGPEPI